jgi:site-specific DNA-methyltransferase (adenine-specific)
MITATNEDNMVMMKRYPDNHFDLAIVDPPYGIGFSSKKQSNFGKGGINHDYKNWDNSIPDESFFIELQRVSKNQIIWGGNYFTEHLKPNRCWLSWYKMQEFSTNEFELAWTSFDKTCKQFNFSRVQAYAGTNKIHPTQKPVKLYEWQLITYAEKGFKILDTHRGSASLDIACHNLGFDLTTCETDVKYFEDGNKRLKQHQRQLTMF